MTATNKESSPSTMITMETLIKSKLMRTAALSRCSLILLAAVSNALLPDHQAGVFQWTRDREVHWTVVDHVVDFFANGLTRWDGEYFLHIADHGYTYENTLAFFPLFPLLVRVLGELIFWLQNDYSIINFESALKLSALTINVSAFIMATILLYDLSRKVLKDEHLAYRSAMFFCVNPASTFFSAVYSESLHFMLTIFAMLKIERGLSVQTGFLLALCTATRANAILTIAFALYKGLKVISYELALYSRLRQLKKEDVSETFANVWEDAIWPILSSSCAIIPFILFQWHGYTEYCAVTKPKLRVPAAVVDYANDNNLKLPNAEPSSWCYSPLPASYFYVQSVYWEVGFLRFYKWKHLPAFVVAAPISFLVLWQAFSFYKRHRHYCFTLGLAPTDVLQARLGTQNVGAASSSTKPKQMYEDDVLKRVLPRECLAYVVHAAVLCLISLLCAHVHITTRLICSGSPIFYWIAALYTSTPKKFESDCNLKSWWRCCLFDEPITSGPGVEIKWLCISYFIGGTILFANWLPWT